MSKVNPDLMQARMKTDSRDGPHRATSHVVGHTPWVLIEARMKMDSY
jgi:hypothetical protein